MIFVHKSLVFAALLSALLLSGVDAHAQSTSNADVLTQAERKHYKMRLSKSNDSAERAKVKSEMNRLIQTRRLELRKNKAPMKKHGPKTGSKR